MKKFLLALLLWPMLAFGQSIGAGGGATAVPPDYTMPPGKIYVKLSTIPKRRLTASKPQIVVTCTGTYTACYQPGSAVPNTFLAGDGSGDGGAFRELCFTSHFSFDDPIVWPGQPGKTHLHQFMGNSNTSSGTDLDNMASAGNSSCAGGILNRTGYWTPTLIYHNPTGSGPVADGTVIPSWTLDMYYKSEGYNNASITQWLDPGVRIIAGNASNTDPLDSSIAKWVCFSTPGTGKVQSTFWDHIPTKAEADAQPQGANSCNDLQFLLYFPQCWNTVDKYIPSPTTGTQAQKATNGHMAYMVAGACPGGYSRQFVTLSYNNHFILPNNNVDLPYVRLSSDQPKATATGACADAAHNYCAGASVHGDWVNGWNTNIPVPIPGNTHNITEFILGVCSHPALDCHVNLIGASINGRGDVTDNASHTWYSLY